MKKKVVALLLAACLTTTLFAACGGSAQQSNGSSAAPAASSEGGTNADAPEGDLGYGFPEGETITWHVPGKSGGGSDLAIRYLAESMTKNLGFTTTVNNYDSNTIGHQTVANSPADGTHITLATAALNIQYITGASNLDPLNDLTLIACLQENGFSALAVPADAPFDTFSEFVDYAKANPGMLNAGQPNSGNNQFAFGMLMEETGIVLNPVECASESDRLTNLAGGFIDIGFVGVRNGHEYETAGMLKVIGTLADDGQTIAQFDSTLPDNYKTLQEQGFDSCYWGVHHYVFGPVGLDAAQVEAMNAALKTVIEDPDCNAGIASLGQIPEWYNVEDSHRMQQEEYDRLVAVAKSLDIYAQG